MPESQQNTLQVGEKMPGFSLSAANQPGKFELRELLTRGPLIVEFLRGTW